MPTLHWIGKEKVQNHHLEVPMRVLNHEYHFEAETPETGGGVGHKIIHGDNLEALKALLPEYEGRVKCIYIDPPYNTGNEGWVYNDNVNDPKLKKWLKQVVGKEGDDLSRHDKWLCMMYPRLQLLHKLLAEDGTIWISIDDNAFGLLRQIMDEIFGIGNFVTNIIWEKADSPRNSARQFSTDHDYILLYSKKPDWIPKKLARTEASNSIYQNPDNDSRGEWIPGDPYANKPYSKGLYTIQGPTGRNFSPPPGRFWRISEEKLWELNKDGRIWWGPKGDARPSIKRYLNEVSDLVPRTLWMKEDVGSNRSSKNEMRSIFPDTSSFDTPKPISLLDRVLQIATSPDSIILDSFAGSGTTLHAVLNLNKADGGNRQCILIEMEDYAETITAERVRRVMKGYGDKPGTGGSFDYFTLGERIFNEEEELNENIPIEAIRQYIWYTETATPLLQPDTARKTGLEPASFLGIHNDTAYYFHWNPGKATTLNLSWLKHLVPGVQQHLVYADNCTLNKLQLEKYKVIFKKIPRDVRR